MIDIDDIEDKVRELCNLLEAEDDNGDPILNEWEEKFISEMIEKFDNDDNDANVSNKQAEKVEEIYDRMVDKGHV